MTDGQARSPAGRTPVLSRRSVLRGAGLGAGLAAGALALPGCARMVGDRGAADGARVLRWAQHVTPQAGPAGEVNRAWLRAVARAFAHDNPGWRVAYEGYDWDKIDQRLLLDQRAGVTHDVVLTSPQLMAQHAAAGTLLDLSPYVARWPESERADLAWNPVWRSCEVAGLLLGVPLGVNARLLLLRSDLLDRAGVDPAAVSDLPALLTAARRVTTAERYGLAMFLGSNRATTELSLAPLTWGFGGDLYDAREHRATLGGAAAVAAAGWIHDAVHRHRVVSPADYAPTAANDAVLLADVLAGRTAMSWSFGNYWIPALEDGAQVHGCAPATRSCRAGDVAAVPLPTPGAAAFTNAWTISVAATCPRPDMAWRLVEAALRPDLMGRFGDAGTPARRSAYRTAPYRTPFLSTWLTAAERGRGMPATPYYQQLADAAAAALQELLGGRRSDVGRVLRRYEQDWNRRYGAR